MSLRKLESTPLPELLAEVELLAKKCFVAGQRESMYFDIAVHAGIEETLSLLDKDARKKLFQQLKSWAKAPLEERPFRIFGGSNFYEPDPVRGEQLARDKFEKEQAESEYFVSVIRPRSMPGGMRAHFYTDPAETPQPLGL